MKIVLATSNKHKVQEINDMVKTLKLPVEFILPPQGFDPEENGKTFEENSYIKALAAHKLAHTYVLADDSGLCIDALSGAPGIYSARWDKTPELRIKKVLSQMNGIKNRNAHFCCAMTLLNPEGKIEYKTQGICEGSITEEPRGKNGFGYDPIFLIKDDTRTMAELSEEEKNKISHRSKALNNIMNYLKQFNKMN